MRLSSGPTESPSSSRRREYLAHILWYRIAHTDRKPEAIAWAKSFTALIDALQAYVKQYHTTGVTWNGKVCITSV